MTRYDESTAAAQKGWDRADAALDAAKSARRSLSHVPVIYYGDGTMEDDPRLALDNAIAAIENVRQKVAADALDLGLISRTDI